MQWSESVVSENFIQTEKREREKVNTRLKGLIKPLCKAEKYQQVTTATAVSDNTDHLFALSNFNVGDEKNTGQLDCYQCQTLLTILMQWLRHAPGSITKGTEQTYSSCTFSIKWKSMPLLGCFTCWPRISSGTLERGKKYGINFISVAAVWDNIYECGDGDGSSNL